MKHISYFSLIAIMPVFFACNTSTKSESKESAIIPAADENIVIVQHPVNNFEHWKHIYLLRDSIRRAFAISHYMAGTGVDDPNQVVVIDLIGDTAKANEFYSRPEVKEAWARAGVIGDAKIDMVHIIRDDSSITNVKDRILVKHKVKDFDTWLKAFDAEGAEKRRSFGIIDRGLGRGISDSNMIYIFFAIEDWNKANERMKSEDLKKIMADAGVEGEPVFLKYKLAL